MSVSGKEIALLRSPPLRTVRASCPAHGSSLRGGEEIPGRTEHPILVSPYGWLSTPVLVQLAPSPSVKASSLIAPLTGSPFGLGIPAFAALSPPLQRSLRFLRHPLPPPPSPFLAVELPPYGGMDGAYPVVQCGEADGAAASYSPAGHGATVVEGSNRRSDPRALLAPACQHLWPVLDYGP